MNTIPSPVKKGIFLFSLLMLSVCAYLFIEGYRLSFKKKVQLEQRGVVVLNGDIKDPIITIDNTLIRTTLPYVSTSLALGNHYIEVNKAGFLPYKEHIFLDAEHAIVRTMVLDPSPALLGRQKISPTIEKRLFLLQKNLLGEYFHQSKKLYMYSSFTQYHTQHPELIYHFPQLHNLPTDIFLDEHDFYFSTPQGILTINKQRTDEVPVYINLPAQFTFNDLREYHNEPKDPLFNQIHFLETLFEERIASTYTKSFQNGYYIATHTSMETCRDVLPSTCTLLFPFTTPPLTFTYWEKELTFVVRYSDGSLEFISPLVR